MYNDDMDNDQNHPLDWSPYDWLIGLEKQLNQLTVKTQQVIRNQKEMAIAYNNQVSKINDLAQRVDTLENILWRSDNQSAIKEYWDMVGRPKR